MTVRGRAVRRRTRRRVESVQLTMFDPTRRKDGKKRRKPGPKRKRGSSSPHRERPEITARTPAHVVLRVHRIVGSLRRAKIYQAIRWATIAMAKHEDRVRIVHVSIQKTHVHLIVEAEDRAALARGMQSFQISAAKLINAALARDEQGRRRRGTVFPDRYHLEVLDSPRRARHALAYVLNNWRKHREDRGERSRTWLVDPFSSGAYFNGWQELEHRDLFWDLPATYLNLFVWLPRSWLLRVGWRKHGLIACHEVPSSMAGR